VSACSWMSDFVVPFGVVPFANPVFEPIGTDDKLPACDRGPIFHPDKEGRLALAALSFLRLYQQGRHQHRYGPQALTKPGPHQRPQPRQAAS
jgi:hypothetical protein